MDSTKKNKRPHIDFKSGENIYYLSFILSAYGYWMKFMNPPEPENRVGSSNITVTVQSQSDIDLQSKIDIVLKHRPKFVLKCVQNTPDNYVLVKKSKHLYKKNTNEEDLLLLELLNLFKTTLNMNDGHLIQFKSLLEINNPLSKCVVVQQSNILKSYIGSDKYISSYTFRQRFLSFMGLICRDKISKEHGPAVIVDGFTDHAPSIHFESWPHHAVEWIIRKRLNNWPPKNIIIDIVRNGHCVVPVSFHEQSKYEWRLSFSLGERLLLNSIHVTRIQILILVKLLCKEIDITFKSYFITTLFFHYMEKLAPTFAINHFQLVLSFIDEILLALAERRITHYFISGLG
jgi:hypothetical protein